MIIIVSPDERLVVLVLGSGYFEPMKLVEPPAVYLDVSVLGRPYDDQSMWRNEMETIALVMITAFIRDDRYRRYYSPVHEEEILRNGNEAERSEILRFLHGYGANAAKEVEYDAVEQRAFGLVDHGVGYADALHVANAEFLDASFITCDDPLLRKCRRYVSKVWCGTPIDFCKKEDLI